ncbi:mitochondrial antiviral-signaling protein [Ascaphus truei]|uniref:mitochondrial antiviral-signaling protein n=1 Tax=Ascaphus truei TaxID=8439 RepID=UPI003F5A14C1
MTFAEDKLLDYLRVNIDLLRGINVVDLLTYITCLSQPSQEKLRQQLQNDGNHRTIWHLIDEMRRRPGWVNQLLSALRQSNQPELADQIQSVYNGFEIPRRAQNPPFSPPSASNYPSSLDPTHGQNQQQPAFEPQLQSAAVLQPQQPESCLQQPYSEPRSQVQPEPHLQPQLQPQNVLKPQFPSLQHSQAHPQPLPRAHHEPNPVIQLKTQPQSQHESQLHVQPKSYQHTQPKNVEDLKTSVAETSPSTSEASHNVHNLFNKVPETPIKSPSIPPGGAHPAVDVAVTDRSPSPTVKEPVQNQRYRPETAVEAVDAPKQCSSASPARYPGDTDAAAAERHTRESPVVQKVIPAVSPRPGAAAPNPSSRPPIDGDECNEMSLAKPSVLTSSVENLGAQRLQEPLSIVPEFQISEMSDPLLIRADSLNSNHQGPSRPTQHLFPHQVIPAVSPRPGAAFPNPSRRPPIDGDECNEMSLAKPSVLTSGLENLGAQRLQEPLAIIPDLQISETSDPLLISADSLNGNHQDPSRPTQHLPHVSIASRTNPGQQVSHHYVERGGVPPINRSNVANPRNESMQKNVSPGSNLAYPRNNIGPVESDYSYPTSSAERKRGNADETRKGAEGDTSFYDSQQPEETSYIDSSDIRNFDITVVEEPSIDLRGENDIFSPHKSPNGSSICRSSNGKGSQGGHETPSERNHGNHELLVPTLAVAIASVTILLLWKYLRN